MQSLTPSAIVFIAVCALSTVATAQKTYKCGDTYSQLPCSGGIVIDATDKRTSAQKAQADLAKGRDAQSAEAMEKMRLQQEKIDLAANTPPVKPASANKANNIRTTQTRKKKKGPEYFTAQIPDAKKKKKDESKS